MVGTIGVGIFIAGFAQATWFADLLGLSLSGAFIISLNLCRGRRLVLPAGHDG